MAKSKSVKSEYRERVEKIVGNVKGWEEYNNTLIFRPSNRNAITLAQINALSQEFDTDRINFNTGYSSEPGYSDVTPGSPGSCGFIEIKL